MDGIAPVAAFCERRWFSRNPERECDAKRRCQHPMRIDAHRAPLHAFLGTSLSAANRLLLLQPFSLSAFQLFSFSAFQHLPSAMPFCGLMLAAARTLRVAFGHLSCSARFAGEIKIAMAPAAFSFSAFQRFSVSAFAFGHASMWLRQLFQVRYRSLRVHLSAFQRFSFSAFSKSSAP